MKAKSGWNASALRVDKERETLRQITVRRLRDAILNQFFTPGDRLIERELCELTGVSRTSVREALRQLESEGLIESPPNRGPVVASLSVDDARNIYEVREALEGLAARLFIKRVDDPTLLQLVSDGEAVVQAIESREVADVLEALDGFYDTLFGGCGNSMICDMMRTLRARMHYLRAATTHRLSDSKALQSMENFTRIVEAAKRRDGPATAEACVAQVRYAAAAAHALLSEKSVTQC